jgi:hypothetical protein
VVLAGVVLAADALIPDGTFVRAERRRRPRAVRHLSGEAVLGAGIVLVGVALIGRDGWRYTTVAMLGAFILCAVGVALNWQYVRDMAFGTSSGPPGRAAAGSVVPDVPVAPRAASESGVGRAAGSAPPPVAAAPRPPAEHRERVP